MEDLSAKERKRLWRDQKQRLKGWILDFFKYSADVNHSFSPQTRLLRLAHLIKILQFQYAPEVDERLEYEEIPLMQALRSLQETYRAEALTWKKLNRRSADQSKKWPDVPEGKTALAVLREGLFVQIIRRCRPRNSAGVLHASKPQASFYATLLIWSELLLEPPRRQQELRTRRIATSCPVKRPADVPIDGVYHPLPPDTVRDRDIDGNIADNYIYRTYHFKGKRYPDGIWVKQICRYKTQKHYGPQDIIIRDRMLADGLTLYDYLGRYLYGCWYVGNFPDSFPYDGWDETLKGRRGRWLTKGLLELEPHPHAIEKSDGEWSWVSFFCSLQTGKEYDKDRFSHLVARSSHEWVGKRITPHTLRYIWATWAFQVGLTDAQIHSLAYAMGSSYATLKKWYEQTTPEDKRRPIEEVINAEFYDYLEQSEGKNVAKSETYQHILEMLPNLSTVEKRAVINQLNAG